MVRSYERLCGAGMLIYGSGSEGLIRVATFLAAFALIAFAEGMAPRRRPAPGKNSRWLNNLLLVLLDTLAVRLLLPVLPVGMALLAQSRGWGLLNSLHAPHWLALAAGIVVLDFVIYLQHVMFHMVPLFWRFHRVHHSDTDFDVTTGVRFHPFEIVLSMVIKLAVVASLGPPPLAVLAFELLLNATSLFNHGNMRIPLGADAWLRLVLVTPDMHRVHHSVIVKETNSNFGFNLSCWDRCCGTYRPQPAAGHEGMVIGLNQYRDPGRQTLFWLLLLPLRAGNRSAGVDDEA
jgi:sterol desaturase/sphingolipid hydroxylase (fatty acid hydroxylase superfamily)